MRRVSASARPGMGLDCAVTRSSPIRFGECGGAGVAPALRRRRGLRRHDEHGAAVVPGRRRRRRRGHRPRRRRSDAATHAQLPSSITSASRWPRFPTLRARLAEMRIAVDVQQAFLEHVADLVENPDPATLLAVLESKAAAAEAALARQRLGHARLRRGCLRPPSDRGAELSRRPRRIDHGADHRLALRFRGQNPRWTCRCL